MLEESNMKSLASIFLHWHFGGANFELLFFWKENDFPSTYRLSETIPLLGTLDRKYNQPMLVYPAKKKQTNACLQDDVDGDGPGLVSTKGAAKATAGLLEYLEQAFFLWRRIKQSLLSRARIRAESTLKG